jgi:hypothetical protein
MDRLTLVCWRVGDNPLVQKYFETGRRRRRSVGLPFLILMTIGIVTGGLDHHGRILLPHPGALHFKGNNLVRRREPITIHARLHDRVGRPKIDLGERREYRMVVRPDLPPGEKRAGYEL